MLESSNVKPIVQITRLIEVNRAYEHDHPDDDPAESDLSRNAVAAARHGCNE